MRRTLTVLAIAAAMTLAPNAHAAEWSPQRGAVFNDPTGDFDAQNRIVTHLDDMIHHAPKGSTVRLATMTLSIGAVADALIDAKRRGVSTRVIMPVSKRNQPVATRIRQALGTDYRKLSWIRFCNGSCYRTAPGDGVMHAKIATFSRTGTATNVTWTSSGNLDASHTRDKYNDSYTTVGNTTLYKAAISYVEKMRVDDFDQVPPMVTSGSYGMQFFPRGGNLIQNVLNDTHCSGTVRTRVRLATSLWDNTRIGVARRLVQLRKGGCDVRVLTQSYRTSSSITKVLHDGKVPMHRADHDGHGNHSKALAISGHYRNSLHANLVWAGSLNLTDGDNGCDNNMVRAPAYTAYANAFNIQWVRSNPAPVTQGVVVSDEAAALDK